MKKPQKTTKDIIHFLSFHPRERVDFFKSLTLDKQTEIILQLSRHLQHEVLSELESERVVRILEQLDPDDATDVLQSLSKQRQKEILNKLQKDIRDSISKLLEFDPQTAAGLMNLDYIQVDIGDTIAMASKHFKTHEKRTGRMPAIVILKKRRVIGYLPGHELGFASPSDRIAKYLKKIQTIKHSASHDEVIDLFRSHPHNKVAVLSQDGGILGIIYSDDVLRIVQEQEAASLYDFAGINKEEGVTDSILAKVKSRYKWLIINLGTAFLAAFTVGLFNETIDKYVLLAVYMPIVAGMGGNAGTQTLAVLVRGIALRQIELKNAWSALRNEAGAGIINGFINGLVVTVVIYFLNQDIRIGFILGMAMVVNLFTAGIFGTLIPLIMTKLGKDPAASATIFITTATDVLGFLTFLGLASIFLN